MEFELKNKAHNYLLLDSLTKAKGFENKEGDYICVLYDLLLYQYPELTKGVYGLLVKYFLRKRICLESIANVQVLENKNSTKMLNDIKKLTQELKKLQSESSFWINKNNQYGKDQKERVTTIFSELERLCSHEDATEPPLAKMTT